MILVYGSRTFLVIFSVSPEYLPFHLIRNAAQNLMLLARKGHIPSGTEQ